MASIVLRVKPIEAEFERMESQTDVAETCGVLYTMGGAAVDPTKMANHLSATYSNFDFPIGISQLRHALEAFSHKFAQRDSGWNSVYAEQANHAVGTSARYGRDEGCFVGIPMDISEANYMACNDWNTVILGSPSIMSKDSKPQLFRQLQDLDLLGSKSQMDAHLSPPTQISKRPRAEVEPMQHLKIIHRPPSVDMSPHCSISPTEHPVSDLRETQTQALLCLRGLVHSAIIVMPTGSGKTQLIWSHRDDGKCSVIFAPYNLLCSQLLSACQQKGTTVQWPLATFNGSVDALLLTAKFAVLPYEAAPYAHSFIAALHEKGRLGPIWIDEVCDAHVYSVKSVQHVLIQVHTLGSRGRFRLSFDDFWNLGANLEKQMVPHSFIGLTATLRQDDVEDVMRRMSVNKIRLFRKSCYRCDARSKRYIHT